MAVRITCASNTFTTAATWALVNNSATTGVSYLDIETGATNIPQTNPTYSANFTWSSGSPTVDGIALKFATRAASPSGTLTAVLRNTTDNVDVKTVTINASDVDSSGLGWYLFKFLSITLTDGKNYAVGLSSSAASQGSLYCGSAGDWCRMLRTTTTGAPAANDQLHVIGEWTAAATLASFTMTMDNADAGATSFGPTVSGGPPQGITVGKGGTWTNGTTASTPYYFKWKGIFAVYGGGTLNIGINGAAMPSTSSAIYEMDSAVNVDTGIVVQPGGIFNAYGNPVAAVSTLLTVSRGGYCTTNGTAVTATASQAQDFTGLTGSIVVNAVSYTISSVSDATHLTLTGSAGVQASPVPWTHAGTANVLTVASTSGWAATDQIVVASTSRTLADSELVTVNSVDSGTQATLSASLTAPHLGISPTIAEVIHLTRNVKIRGVSTSLQGYIVLTTTSVTTLRYVEIYQLGSNTAGKRGIDAQATTGVIDIQYCSLHNFAVTGSLGINHSGVGSGTALIFSYNVSWLIDVNHLVLSASGATATAAYNVFVRNVSNYVVNLPPTPHAFNYNTVVSGVSGGIAIGANAPGLANTITGNTVHSCTGAGIVGTNSLHLLTLANSVVWRNGGGFNPNVTMIDVTVSGLIAFGNNSSNIDLGNGIGFNSLLTGLVLNGDVVFATASNINIQNWGHAFTIENSNLSTVSGILTAATRDINFSATSPYATVQIFILNTILAAGVQITGLGSISRTDGCWIAAQRLGQVAGTHKTWMYGGTLRTDTVIYNTASPSMRMTPSSASVKLPSAPLYYGMKFAVASGNTATVSVHVRKSISTDASGANYNGNQPRLILRKNVAAGIAADTVLATLGDGSNPDPGLGAWATLTGTTTPAVTDDTVLEVIVDCNGTAGWVNIDDFLATPPMDSRGFKAWGNGLPAVTGDNAAGGGGGGFPVLGGSVVR